MPTPMPRIPRPGGHPSASSPLSALLYALSLLSALVLLAAFPGTSLASAGDHERPHGSCARPHALVDA
ncbi:hypothetical protein ACFZB6_17235 [Streptomyces syringium]|uniref:hypothetical protein n=1 Tax=Streptomyces syringium TaxID=76729 RepID=UPI0033B4FFDA